MPIPVKNLFTYLVTEEEYDFIQPGLRVAVPFGRSGIYTALVHSKTLKPPTAYQAKEIYQILDELPVITSQQLSHWEWISSYYMCSLGEVMRAALPKAFLLESETLVVRNEAFTDPSDLEEEEFTIWQALEYQEELSLEKVSSILEKKRVLPVIKSLLEKKVVIVREEIYEQYKPKMVKYVRLHPNLEVEDALKEVMEQLSRAKKQREVMMQFFTLRTGSKKEVSYKMLLQKSGATSAILKSLTEKQFLEVFERQVDRVVFSDKTEALRNLSEEQEQARIEIDQSFSTKDVCLLHGITSSGKTEIYSHLIQETLERGEQVLYLLPEIALTTQLIARLEKYFGNRIAVYHSRYSMDERMEVWQHLVNKDATAQLILGARSSVLLPYSNLGLIIVDEEHESSFKQFDPAPRYHARDAAIVLASYHKAKVILGSATPSVETYYNALNKKYGYIQLNSRYSKVLLPETELVDIKDKYRRKRMQGHFSDRLTELINEALESNEQIILFQNRRGYSPVVECKTCGVAPQCVNCDVSLTYHKYREELRCHYCGYHRSLPKTCGACGNASLDTKGFGTEQIEIELKELFPQAKVARMDLDTTRGKYSYQNLLQRFQDREVDILVGTQMLTKGLDFQHVSLVGVLNADNMLNFPDFRAEERTFQILVQVAGRAGRSEKRGKVAIQTFNPYHQILQQVTTNDYESMYKDQMNERHQFHYPPLVRLIKVTLMHKDYTKVQDASIWLGRALQNQFGDKVLGPTSPPVSRVRNRYIRTLLIKVASNQISASKKAVLRIQDTFQSIAEYRPVRIVLDVDNY